MMHVTNRNIQIYEIYQFYIFPWSVGKVYLSMRLINLICFCSQSVTKLFNVEFLFSRGISSETLICTQGLSMQIQVLVALHLIQFYTIKFFKILILTLFYLRIVFENLRCTFDHFQCNVAIKFYFLRVFSLSFAEV